MKAQLNLFDEMIVDNFAGGGGASTGIELALGRPVDVAINHDIEAIRMHELNHPYTRHYCEDVWNINPREVAKGRSIALAWFSPDCKHFSKAKGGKPVEKKIRGLAWVAVRWAATVKPRVIILENVEEFKTWGKVVNGQPDPKHKGKTFQSFVRQLERLGYDVKWTTVKACDYGAPTIRKRFFLVARCDGMPIVFPTPTHGNKPGLKPYRTAAEIIDFNIPMKSIFDRPKPLAEATMRRIARGIKKFVIDNPKPFIMQMNFDNPPQSIDKPLSTLTTVGKHFVVAPTMVQIGYGEANGQQPRALDIQKPLGTITSGGNKFALVSAFMSKYFSGDQTHASGATEPLPTVTAIDHNSLVAVYLDQRYGGEHRIGADIMKPLPTVTTVDHNQLLTVDIQPNTNVNLSQANKATQVAAFLMKYYGGEGESGQSLTEPLHTIRTKDCFCLITVDSIDYIIADIKMRMLEPRELFNAQGFPPDYKIDTDISGKPISKAAQIARCGNSVCPAVAEAFVRANLAEYASRTQITTMAQLNREIAV